MSREQEFEYNASHKKMTWTPFRIAAASIAGVVAAGLALDSITIVQPRQRAIPVTLGHKGHVLHEGLSFVWPILTNVNKFDLTLNISENKKVALKSKDSQTIYLDVIGHYCLTAGCLDPEKAENVPDSDIDKQYYTFRSTDYHSVYNSFLLEAAVDAIGKRAITDIAKDISVIADEIKAGVIKKLTDSGYSSLHTQDVLLRNFAMEPSAEAFANNVANDMQRTTQLKIQFDNLDQETKNATRRGEVTANELKAAAAGIAESVKTLSGESGISREEAAALIKAQMVAGKWDGKSLTPPVVFAGGVQPPYVLVGGDLERPHGRPASAAPAAVPK